MQQKRFTIIVLYNKNVAGSYMQNVTGQVVEGEDFFDREFELIRFWESLKTDNLILLAPRRVGKSSLLRHMKAKSPEHDFNAIYIEVSDCSDELRFVKRLYQGVLEHGGAGDRLWDWIKDSWLGNTVSRVQKIGSGVFNIEFADHDLKWERLGEELAGALNSLDEPTLIQIDELPVFALKLVNRKDPTDQARIREFLYWLRRLRQSYPKIRWMLAGSIGLDTVAARLNIADSINDLRIETLGAFDSTISHRFLETLAGTYRIDLSQEIREYIISRVGWPIPFHLQLVFDKLRHCSKPEFSDVDSAINALLGPFYKAYFDYWRQRLRDELGRPDSDHAVLLLNTVCVVPQGVPRTILNQALFRLVPDPDERQQKLLYLMDVLHNDGYLVEQNGQWLFRSPLLCAYWRRHVAPPEQRDE